MKDWHFLAIAVGIIMTIMFLYGHNLIEGQPQNEVLVVVNKSYYYGQ